MRWAHEDKGLGDSNLSKVFRYEERETTVVKIVKSKDVSTVWYPVSNIRSWLTV
jgi:hypothetical protein